MTPSFFSVIIVQVQLTCPQWAIISAGTLQVKAVAFMNRIRAKKISGLLAGCFGKKKVLWLVTMLGYPWPNEASPFRRKMCFSLWFLLQSNSNLLQLIATGRALEQSLPFFTLYHHCDQHLQTGSATNCNSNLLSACCTID